MKRILSLTIVGLILAGTAFTTAAEETDSLSGTKDKLESVEKRLESAEKKIARSEAIEITILGSMETLDREISRAKKNISNLRSEERALIVRIQESERSLKRISREQEAIAQRLIERAVSLYKAGHVGYLKVIFEANGVEDLERRSFYLKKLAEQDSSLFARATEIKLQEKRQNDLLHTSKSKLTFTRRDLEETLAVLARKKSSKSLLLAAVRDEKDKNSRLRRELEDSAKRLIKLLEALELQAETGQSAFATLKGSIKRPVSGRIITDFGRNRNERFDTFTLSRGVTIQSAEGTPIRSVYKGQVIFADWFRGYGKIVILDHGGGYYTLYGHLSQIRVENGQEVLTDTIIGYVGDSGSLKGPALYFEIRHHGKPVDPNPWFSG